MKTIASIVIVSLILLCGYKSQGAWSDDPNYRRPFPLPVCPDGCKIVLYGPLPKGIMGKKSEETDDWKSVLIELGVKFSNGGFALFYRPGRMLAVATDSKNQELVQIMVE